MSNIVIWLISLYQKTYPSRPGSCKFLPTCSQYSKDAFVKYSFLKGLYLSIWRILRCHPWQKNSYDPVK